MWTISGETIFKAQDAEAIEALVASLQQYDGTLILVSHDRWFVSQLATRVVEISAAGIRDYPGTYDEYVHACGDDHLDADSVVLRTKRDRSQKGERSSDRGSVRERHPPVAAQRQDSPAELEQRRAAVTAEIERIEVRIAELDALFCQPGWYDATTPTEVSTLTTERDSLQQKLEELFREWERIELEIAGTVA